jgi:UrcA family protein
VRLAVASLHLRASLPRGHWSARPTFPGPEIMDLKMIKSYVAHALGLSLAATALLAYAQPASAHLDDRSTSVVVRFADLDINHPAGAERLLDRIEQAADTACGGEPSSGLDGERRVYRQCRTDAITRAVDQLNAPLLTAVAAGRLKPIRLAGH